MSHTTTSSNGEEVDPTGAGFDRVLDTLCHPHRRHVLKTIADASTRDRDEFFLTELTLGTDDAEQFTTQLVHVHLPKLAELGYIQWDRAGNSVTRGEHYDEIIPLVTLVTEYTDELPADSS